MNNHNNLVSLEVKKSMIKVTRPINSVTVSRTMQHMEIGGNSRDAK